MNLLLAIDESTCSEAAADAVIAQFRPSDIEVRVVHVITWPQELPTAWAYAAGPSAAQSVLGGRRELHRRGRELLARAVDRLQRAGFKATPTLVEGGAREAIVAMAADWPADTIVIGSHGRTGIQRVLLGSVSSGVVRHATCSVHVVRESREKLAADVTKGTTAGREHVVKSGVQS
jgi:nucleotide-binding universal stress UspA family protein